MTLHNEPSIKIDLDANESDNNVDNIIDKMNLTTGELETLNCYMAGLGFVEIAELLTVNLATVWRRRKRLQQKYLMAYPYTNY